MHPKGSTTRILRVNLILFSFNPEIYLYLILSFKPILSIMLIFAHHLRLTLKSMLIVAYD